MRTGVSFPGEPPITLSDKRAQLTDPEPRSKSTRFKDRFNLCLFRKLLLPVILSRESLGETDDEKAVVFLLASLPEIRTVFFLKRVNIKKRTLEKSHIFNFFKRKQLNEIHLHSINNISSKPSHHSRW